jgi:hypothetical protein
VKTEVELTQKCEVDLINKGDVIFIMDGMIFVTVAIDEDWQGQAAEALVFGLHNGIIDDVALVWTEVENWQGQAAEALVFGLDKEIIDGVKLLWTEVEDWQGQAAEALVFGLHKETIDVVVLVWTEVEDKKIVDGFNDLKVNVVLDEEVLVAVNE